MRQRLGLAMVMLLLAFANEVYAASSFKILSDDRYPGIKRSVDVELPGPCDESALRSIAKRIKAADSADYPRTFILYYLPGMKPGAGAWAATHFNPKLEVTIYGLSRESEAVLSSQASSPEVVGRWISTGGLLPGVFTIERGAKGLALRLRLNSGANQLNPLVEKEMPAPGQTYHYVEPSSTGEYLRVNASGDLEILDEDGLIATGSKK